MRNLIILFVITLLINVSFFLSLPETFIEFGSIKEIQIELNMEKIDSLSEELHNSTGADHIWIWLFHHEVDDMYNNIYPVFNLSDLYISSPYIWHKPDIEITQNTKNIKLNNFPDINETFDGKCISRITTSRDINIFRNLRDYNLIIRCPLYDNSGGIIGIFGITILSYELLSAKLNDTSMLAIVKGYSKLFTNALFE